MTMVKQDSSFSNGVNVYNNSKRSHRILGIK